MNLCCRRGCGTVGTTFGIDPDAHRQRVRPARAELGVSIQYSTPDLKLSVVDLGMREFIKQLSFASEGQPGSCARRHRWRRVFEIPESRGRFAAVLKPFRGVGENHA
jgi:hypothetical protein